MCVAKPQREAGPDFRQAPDGSQDFPAEFNHVVLNKSDRALVEMLGGQVTDEHRCAQYCESLLGGSLECAWKTQMCQICCRELFSRCKASTVGPAGGVHHVQAVRLDLVVLNVLTCFDPLT